MDFEPSAKAREYQAKLQQFMDEQVYPAEAVSPRGGRVTTPRTSSDRIFDGPDEVHVRSVARQELRRYGARG
jgi:hypothetical protein